MDEKLDFSLPEKNRTRSLTGVFSIILLLVLLVLISADILVFRGGGSPTMPGAQQDSQALTAEQVRDLAARLSGRNLYRRAASVWQEYLARTEISNGDRARGMFQVGVLLEKAGSYDEAIEYFYRSEMCADLDDLAGRINSHIKDCFTKLGKFSALRYELMDRTSLEKNAQAGTTIVAEIGAERITEADLDALIERTIDNQLSPLKAFMAPDQLNEQKRKMLQQFKTPDARQQFLQGWLGQEILYREALEQQLAEEPEVKNLLNDQAQALLSRHLMNQQLAEKIHITETDLQTYYAANKQEFTEPAVAKISHILVDDANQAKDLILRIKNAEDFAALARDFSKDESTRQNNGKIDADVTEGSYVAGIGSLPELNAKIFAAEPPVVLDEPVKTEKGWEIIKVESKTPQRQKTFDEVRQDVMSQLLGRKRADVQQDYIEQMMNKYNVVIHTSAFTGETQGDPNAQPENK